MLRALLGIGIALALPPQSEQIRTPAGGEAATTVVVKKNWLTQVAERYESIQSAKMNIKKSVKYAFLDKSNTSQGDLLFKRNHFRLDLDGSDGRSIFLIRENLLQVLTLPKGSELQPQLLEGNWKKGGAQGQKALSALLSGKGLDKHFQLLKETIGPDFVDLKLKPKESVRDLENVKARVNKKSKLIQELLIIDELGNETKFTMSNIELNVGLDEKKFKEKIPANAVKEKF